jgi:hypothetical protein
MINANDRMKMSKLVIHRKKFYRVHFYPQGGGSSFHQNTGNHHEY